MADYENPNSIRYSEFHFKKTNRRPGTKGDKGYMFEKKTLMLVLYQACEYGLDFTLDTNVSGYGAFDDIIFVCKDDGGRIHRIFAQQKHKESENSKITYDQLWKSNNDFCLYNFFIDYIDYISEKHENDQNYLIILTNIDFKWPSEEDKGRIIREDKDNYFVFKKLNTSDFEALTVFDPLTMKKDINFTKKQHKNPSFYQFSYETDDGQRNIDRVLDIFKKEFLSIDQKKAKDKQKLQFCEKDPATMNSMLTNFLESLVFATDMYDEITLGHLITEKLGQTHAECLSSEIRNVFLYVLDEITLWRDRNVPPLTENNNYFKIGFEISDNITFLHLLLKYEIELNSLTIGFTQEVYENIKDFINSEKQLWHISSEGPWLNSLPIYQALNQMTFDENSKINYSSRDHRIFLAGNHLIEVYPETPQSLFRNMKESILVIACTSNDLKDKRICEMLDMIAKIVFESAKYRKQIILIAPCELASKLPNFTRLSVFADKKQDINFDRLTDKAQDDFKNKKNIRFQGNEELFSIKELVRLEEDRSVSIEAIKKLNLDALELEKLLRSDSVEIGNEPPEFSELDSIHIKPLSLIKESGLQRAIVNLQDTNSHLQDIFVFVGTESDVEKLLPEDEKPVTFEDLDLSNVSNFWPPRFILLKRGNDEDKQFKQLCRSINQAHSRRLLEEAENVVRRPRPTLHLLKKRKEEWMWMRSYCRELYIRRQFYPLFINKFKLIDLMLENSLLCPLERETNKKISLKSRVSDFIIVSEIEPNVFLESLDINSSEVQKQIKKFIKRAATDLNTENNFEPETFSLDFNDDYKTKTVFPENSKAQEEFQKLSRDILNFADRGQSVHWLKAKPVNDNGQIRFQWYWYRSEGEIKRIRSVLDDERKDFIEEESLLDNNSPIIVIADEPGMGKSTTLVSMAEMMKKSKPWLWVIKVDMNQHQKTLAERVESLANLSLVDLITEVLSTIDEKLTDSLTHKIFMYKLNCAAQVLILCDGFDEVRRERHEAVLNVLRFLRRKTAAKICITTRSYCKEKLEENLSVLAHLFEPIDEKQQIIFLSHFWKEALKLTQKISDLSVLEEYASKIIKKFVCILGDPHTRSFFISVPLRARMLAEIFRETIKDALRGDETAVNHIKSREKISIGNLYDQFIQKKYEIYFHEKIMIHEDGGFDEELEFLMNFYTEIYGVLAVENIFGFKIAEHPNTYKKEKFTFIKLSQIGLIQGNDASYNFIHRTFGEYFAGRWLAVACQTSNARKIIREKLLMKEYTVLRHFFDFFMSEGILLHRAILQGDESKFSELLTKNTDVSDKLGRTALHLAAQEGRLKMIDDLKERKVRLVADKTGKTPLHYAAISFVDEAAFNVLDEGFKVRTHVGALLENIDNNINLDDHILKSPLLVDTDAVYTSIFKKSICDQAVLVRTVNKRDGAKKSAVEYAAEHQHWGTACVLVLHGADISFLTEEQKKELFRFALEETHEIYSNDYHPLRPVVGLLAIQVPEIVQNLFDTYEYSCLLSYFFAYGHTKVIDSLMRSIQNIEIRKRVARDSDEFPLRSLASNNDLCLSDEEYKKIIEYYDTKGREELRMKIKLADINALLKRAANEGFIRSFRYLYELYAREQNEKPFSTGFLEKNDERIKDLYRNIRNLRYDDEWFQNFTTACSECFCWNRLHFVAINKFVDSSAELSDLSHFDGLKTKDKYGYTPLFYGCKHRAGSKFIKRLFSALEERHLDKDQLYEIIHTKDNYGATPLHYVISEGFLESTEALFSNMLRIGFDKKQLKSILTHKNSDGITPMWKIRYEGCEFVKLFMKYLKEFDFSPEECIHILKSSGDLLHELIRRVLCDGAALDFLAGIENLPLDEDQRSELVNCSSNGGNTPLHEAAKKGYRYDIVLRLFRNGAIFNAPNSSEELPLDLIRDKLGKGEYYEKTYFLLNSISDLFKLIEDQLISQNPEKLDQFKKIIFEIKDKSWIDPKSILNAHNSKNETLRDVKDTVIRDLLQELRVV